MGRFRLRFRTRTSIRFVCFFMLCFMFVSVVHLWAAPQQVLGQMAVDSSTAQVARRDTVSSTRAETQAGMNLTQSIPQDTPSSVVPSNPPSVDLAKLPLSFVPNRGQTDARARFIARGLGGTVFFTDNALVLNLATDLHPVPAQFRQRLDKQHPSQRPKRMNAVQLRYLGAAAAPTLAGDVPLAGTVNEMLGNDPAKWHTNLPTYAGVVYRQLYSGIDLYYDGTQGQLKGTYVLAPGADPT